MILKTRHRRPKYPGIDGTPYDCIVTKNFTFYLNFMHLSKIRIRSPEMILDTRHRRPGCPRSKKTLDYQIVIGTEYLCEISAFYDY